MTPQELTQQVQQRNEEYQALALLWESFLPVEARPGRYQFSVWIDRYGLEITRKGIVKCGDKYIRLVDEGREMDQDYIIRYASGVMSNTLKQPETYAKRKPTRNNGRPQRTETNKRHEEYKPAEPRREEYKPPEFSAGELEFRERDIK